MSVLKRSFQLVAWLSAAVIVVASIACNPGGSGSGTVALQGAGATFPNPLYQKWLSEYGRAHPNVRIDYQSIGSGGGIKQIHAKTVTFGASDAPRPGKPTTVAAETKLAVISLACTKPEDGSQRWSHRKLAGKLIIKFEILDSGEPTRILDLISDDFTFSILFSTDGAATDFLDMEIEVKVTAVG